MGKSILTSFQQEVLHQCNENTFIRKNFYLTGGTALAEFYLQHRFSEDLDFFSEEEFSILPIRNFIKKITTTLHVTEVTYRSHGDLHMFFLHKKTEVLKIDFNHYPFPRIEIGKKYLQLPIDSMRDIAVNKIQTIATKPRSRDFIDLYCILKENKWTIDELQKDARNKFDWYVDYIQLGSKLLLVKELKDYPRMILSIDQKEVENFWLEQAEKFKTQVLT